MDSLEPHNLADLSGCPVEKTVSISGPIRTKPCHFRDFVLLGLRCYWPTDNHRAYQFAVNLSAQAKPMPHNFVVMAMHRSYKSVCLFSVVGQALTTPPCRAET